VTQPDGQQENPPACGVHNLPMELDFPTDEYRCTSAGCQMRISGLQAYSLSQSLPGQQVVVMPERAARRV
jgi:hypothetical protein